MAVSETSICNRALAQIGTRSTIASLTEASNEAKQCNLIFSETQDEILGMAFWNFATKTATLTLLKSAPGTPPTPTTTATAWSDDFPAPPWLYEYEYPSDCLQMRQIVPMILTGAGISPPLTSNLAGSYPYVWQSSLAVPFAAATDLVNGNQANVILTNQYQALGTYTMRVSNPLLWSTQFVQALVSALAAKLAIPLVGDKQLMNQMFQLANNNILSARASDGNEGTMTVDNEVDWISIRDGCGFDGPCNGFIAPYSALYAVI